MLQKLIKEIGASFFYYQHAIHQMELIKLVSEAYTKFDYGHIVHVEALLNLFEGGLNAYNKEYHPSKENITLILVEAIKNERFRPYQNDSSEQFPSIDSLLSELREWWKSLENKQS